MPERRINMLALKQNEKKGQQGNSINIAAEFTVARLRRELRGDATSAE